MTEKYSKAMCYHHLDVILKLTSCFEIWNLLEAYLQLEENDDDEVDQNRKLANIEF